MFKKFLKYLTILSFLLITFDTGHLGGQFGYFAVLGLFAGGITTIISLIILAILILFLISAVKPFKSKDFYVFLIGGAVLIIPIIMHIRFLILNMKNRNDTIFYLTTFIFLTIYIITLLQIKNSNKKNTKQV